MRVRAVDTFDSLRCKPLLARLRMERFKIAQDRPEVGFDNALAEIRAGEKRGDWIWYVFPQLAGLGRSEHSRVYGIANTAEAAEYLRDPLLRSRLLAIVSAVNAQQDAGTPLRRLMGSSIDLLKLVSSMTLFGAASQRLALAEPDPQCAAIAAGAEKILKGAKTEGYPPCQFTMRKL